MERWIRYLAEVQPKPAALYPEVWLFFAVFGDILVHASNLLLTLADKMVCYDESVPISEAFDSFQPSKPSVSEYLAQICGTQIRMENKAYILISVAYTFCLFLLLLVNKFFVGRINRYVDIINRNETTENVRNYTIGSYYLRLTGKLDRYAVHKFIFLLPVSSLQIAKIVASDPIQFEGITCGPEMDYAPPIGMQLTCRFQQESIIWFLDLISFCLAILIIVLLVLSIITIIYYRKFSLPKHIEHAYKADGIDNRILDCKPEEKKGLERLFFFVFGPKQEGGNNQTGKYYDLLRAKKAREGEQQPLITELQRSYNEMENVVEIM